MKLTNRRLNANSVFIHFICMMLLFLLTACGDNSKGTGSIAFSLSIQEFQDAGSRQFAATCLPRNQARGSVEKKSPVSVHLNSPAFRLSGLARYASFFGPSTAFAHSPGEAIDCEGHQIDKIVAYVYDEMGIEIAMGGPWSCDLHGGSIRVPAGVNLTLKLFAIEICSGEKIFYGEKGGLDDPLIVLPGETTDAGRIVLERIFNSWQLSTIDPSIGCINGYYDASLATSIAISPKDDSVHIAYFDCGDNDIKYATNASGSWKIEILPKADDEIPIGFTSLALDSNELPHISYIGDYCQDGCYALYYATKGMSGEWSLREAYRSPGSSSDTEVAPRNTSIEVRSETNGKVADITCIIGNDYLGFSILYVNCLETDETCSSVSLEPGEFASLAHDSNKLAHIGYFERQGSERYIEYLTNAPLGEWQETDTLDNYNAEYGTAETSIALDSNDTVHMSYCDIMNSNLKYITGVREKWKESEIVENIVYGCDHHSVAVDSYGKVHVSYNVGNYDVSESTYELKYAIRGPECWFFHIVDNEEISGSYDVGSYNSIAVDSNDNVHISYYDAYNGALKYAMRATQH